MSLSAAHVAQARQVADAILYEGYLLYPYRQSARKNQARFQFGVLMPPAYAAVDDQELSASQTELLAECADDAQVEILLRFLRVQQRLVQRPAGAAVAGRGLADRERHRIHRVHRGRRARATGGALRREPVRRGRRAAVPH